MSTNVKCALAGAATLGMLALTAPLAARADGPDMLERYRRAEVFWQALWSEKVVRNATEFPTWIEDSNQFWYVRSVRGGHEYRTVDAAAVSNRPALDHAALAAALQQATGRPVEAAGLPLQDVRFRLQPFSLTFQAFDRHWRFDGKELSEAQAPPPGWVLSPDGSQAAFVRDDNLWVRDLSAGRERALTTDGEEDFNYAAIGTAWGAPVDSSAAAQLRWSPDSKRILTLRRDTRAVEPFPILEHVPADGSLRPKVSYQRIAIRGDAAIEEYRLLAIDVSSGRIQYANYRAVPVSRNSPGFFNANLGWWNADSRRAWFVDQPRGDRSVRVVAFDTDSGATRVLFEETSPTEISLMPNGDALPRLLPLPASSELLWYSERSGFAHLYLYDLKSGQVERAVTAGDWRVRDVIRFDAPRRELFISATGRDKQRDPYLREILRVNIDSGEIATLASGEYDCLAVSQTEFNALLARGAGTNNGHANGVAPTGDYLVVTRSRADEVPETILLDRDGKLLLRLESADTSDLPSGWRWPEPVKLLAADGETDIYGLVFRPTDFDPNLSYPVLHDVYNSPDFPWVAKGAFNTGVAYGWSYFEALALAELGFIVVQLDGRGTPYRSKAFADASYGWIPSASRMDDQIAGIRQLAQRYPYMDLERVGIFNLLGGPGGIPALLEFPNFYQVGVSATLHDSRLMPANMWGDKFEGLDGPDPSRSYPEKLASRLQGKLFLTVGLIDAGYTAGTLRAVEALQRANKDFELVIEPRAGHILTNYQARRAWDFVVRNLAGEVPPKEFELSGGMEALYGNLGSE